MKAIRFSTEANLDIEEITDHLFELNPHAAYHFLDSLGAVSKLLSEHPLIGRARPELNNDLRSIPIGNYIVFYLPAQKEVFIVRVLYGGRNLPKFFER